MSAASRWIGTAAFVLGILVASPPLHAGVGGEFTLGHDNNLANVREGGRLFEDGYSLVRFQAEQAWALGRHSAVLLQASGQAQNHFEVQGLTNLRGQLLLRYLLKPGRGYFVPTLALSGSAAGLAYDSELRDVSEYRALLYVTQPLSTRLSLRASLAATWHRDSDDAIFDDDTTQLGFDLEWQALPALLVYAGYQWRQGEFVAVGLPAAPVLAAARAYGPDDVFEGLIAFRQDGEGGIASLGLNHALTPKLALDLQLQRADVESDFGVHYRRTISVASLLFRY
ncbi:MAG TPA: hypothetical protein VGE51_10620 [Fontimonas sp.]